MTTLASTTSPSLPLSCKSHLGDYICQLKIKLDNNASVYEINQILSEFPYCKKQLTRYLVFDDCSISRTLICCNENFSLYLQSWNSNQETPLIDFRNKETRCWIRILEGSLKCKRYIDEENEIEQILERNRVNFYEKGTLKLHKFSNDNGLDRTVSLVLFSPAYMKCCYRTNSGEETFVPCIYSPEVVSTLDQQQLFQLRLRIESSDTVFINLQQFAHIVRDELNRGYDIPRITRVLSSLELHSKEWNQYVNWASHRYTRNLIAYDEKFMILLLCWERGQESPIHDHSGSSCWVKMLHGELVETKYSIVSTDISPNGLKIDSTTRVSKNQVTYIDDTLGIHKMGNQNANSPAISLHVYSPPYSSCNVFAPESGNKHKITIGRTAAMPPFLNLPELKYHVNITSLVSLLEIEFKQLEPCEKKLAKLLEATRLDPHEYRQYVHFSDFNYLRSLITANEKFSLMLLCWNKSQSTPIHDHGSCGRKCWVKVLEGTLIQNRYIDEHDTNANASTSTSLVTVESIELNSNSPVTMDDDSIGIHKTENASNECIAISLHLYSPPYLECVSAQECKSVPVVYCSSSINMFSSDQNNNNNSSSFTSLSSSANTSPSLSPRSPRMNAEVAFTNFDEFITLLNEQFSTHAPSPGGLLKFLKLTQFNPEEWKKYAKFHNQHYVRHIIAEAPQFSLLLTCWRKGQSSSIHDHAGSRSWIKMLEGTLEEKQYEIELESESDFRIKDATVLQENILQSETAVYRAGSVIHQISATKECAVSLHIYSPPLENVNCFNLINRVKLSQHSSSCYPKK
eukprot:TRINITY_DN577_c2_g1_i1.p1 TRINITY_DN577_c2_g1~~TRINITY_DN577_c2_g1_i1.p1  ORF type:complete len:799 (+),score=301.21 TRINITY_DN577_c2_g1_i1:98-2494(+)